MKIAFLWCAGSPRNWDDGLAAAMSLIEKHHTVEYFLKEREIPEINAFNPDWTLVWGNLHEPYFEKLETVRSKKALLFAGGEPQSEWRELFDVIFVESSDWQAKIEGSIRAFGTNTDIFYPQEMPKAWKGIFPATFADWKRHYLFAEALGEDGLCVGRKQERDTESYKVAWRNNCGIINEVPRQVLRVLYNMSEWTVLPSDYWGGSQRPCVESLACGTPVVTFEDSKPAEFVRESGCGVVVSSEAELKKVLILENPEDYAGGEQYIRDTWTHQHYAKNILNGLERRG